MRCSRTLFHSWLEFVRLDGLPGRAGVHPLKLGSRRSLTMFVGWSMRSTGRKAALDMKRFWLNGSPYLSLPYRPLTISLNSSEPGGSKLAFNS